MSRIALMKKGGKWFVKNIPVTRYWKYVDTPFQYPTLTENGTLGGDSFAVYASTTWGGYPAYQACDNNENTHWLSADYTTPYFIFYNPKPLVITSLGWSKGWSDALYLVSGTIYGSNDNSNWTSIGTLTGGYNTAVTSSITNPNAYNYYKIDNVSRGSHGWNINELNITATEREIIETTQDDYDFTTVENHYYGFKKG